jgi:hypothetical protein
MPCCRGTWESGKSWRPAAENLGIREIVETCCGNEPQKTGTKSTCCGDSFWGEIPPDAVKRQMTRHASEMPVDDVVVYCVSCCKSEFIGGKRPRYMLDLLFGEETEHGIIEPAKWHRELDDYIHAH